MKFTTTTLLVFFAAAAVNVVLAQDTTGIPDCAIPCFQTAIASSGCSVTDTVCQCTTGLAAITASATPCVLKSCQPSDIAKVQTASAAICAKAVGSSIGATSMASTMTNSIASVSGSTFTATSATGSAKGSIATSSTGAVAQSTGAAAEVNARSVMKGLGVAVLGFVGVMVV
ncbi:hypothetical protein K432DRAFT_376849 [Lepidopterella palustris CBS 459.81]|uniref:CFEM domain-containing protein n=1 Tax=Lepidopterella palustris CBS 459.81 TaxID=1314670 RepID=A0A8E2JL14_9PEZI|nr:hypothetical protein K432DRAFT_376849 [Lepidopterella palustris CBS 459.81]